MTNPDASASHTSRKTRWKSVRVLLVAAMACGLVVPLGFTLAIATQNTGTLERQHESTASLVSSATFPRLLTSNPATADPPQVPDSILLLGMGALLLGLASLVRRTG